ncbi:MAG TPA: hypothetical protein VGO43_14270 [Pyrinomonadaceae bacterium]|jgi:hypothetical protein|nr:hypothetical protein [Pyrinomonadaceae bacterium]
MFSAIILFALFAAAFFSAENLVAVIAGAVVTYVGTNVIKNSTGIYRLGALVLTVLVSVVVAGVAVLVSSYMGGEPFSFDALGKAMPQIFTLATIAYKVLNASPNSEV